MSVELRASMIDGCASCADWHSADTLAGEDVRRLLRVAAEREAEWSSPAERVALALTRRGDPARWARRQRRDRGCRSVRVRRDGAGRTLVAIATIDVSNRASVSTRTPAPPLAP